jgi:hypothetical protein
MDEFETIRVALGAPETDDAAKARAWARLQREIVLGRTVRTKATPTPISDRDRRPSPRRRYAVLVGIAAAIAFIAIVLQVVLPSGSGGPQAFRRRPELRRLAGPCGDASKPSDRERIPVHRRRVGGTGSGEDLTSGLSWDLLAGAAPNVGLRRWLRPPGDDGPPGRLRVARRSSEIRSRTPRRFLTSAVERYGRKGYRSSRRCVAAVGSEGIAQGLSTPATS